MSRVPWHRNATGIPFHPRIFCQQAAVTLVILGTSPVHRLEPSDIDTSGIYMKVEH